MKWLGAQALGDEADRAIPVQDKESNCHSDRVQFGRWQLVDADQLITSPLAILALSREAVPDRQAVWRQVAHEAEGADKPSEIASKIDNQSRAARDAGKGPIEFTGKLLTVYAREKCDLHVADSCFDLSRDDTRWLRHRRLRLRLARVCLWQNDLDFKRRSVRSLDSDRGISAQGERW
jgi:hypothetical protein